MRAAAARPPKSARAKADGMLKHPYLLFIGNAADSLAAKTAAGIVQRKAPAPAASSGVMSGRPRSALQPGRRFWP